MPQEDDGASELDHPEEIFWVVFPANDGATKVMKPGEQAFHFPATPVAAQNTPVLRRHSDAHEFVGRDELHSVSFVDALVQRIAVVSAVADHAFRGFGKESPVKLASMKDSLRSSFPRSRKSSASFCSKRVSSPLRCHCWKRR